MTIINAVNNNKFLFSQDSLQSQLNSVLLFHPHYLGSQIRLFSFDFLLSKAFSYGQSECQTVLIQIRTNILSVMIWVQTVCKGYKPFLCFSCLYFPQDCLQSQAHSVLPFHPHYLGSLIKLFSLDFLLSKAFSYGLLKCQTVWIQIRTDILSVMI